MYNSNTTNDIPACPPRVEILQICIKLVFALGLMFLVSACGLQDKEIYQDSWNEDVLVAQECGLSGLTCCFDEEQKCQSGLECCFNPNDQNKAFCSESCDFGKVDKYCRKDEPRCDDKAVCVNDYCAECGVIGNPCCDGKDCIDQDKKDINHGECLNSVCTLCGYSGEVSCQSDFGCMPGNLNNGGFCNKCGGLTQPCCAGEDDCNTGLKCELGFCS